MDILLKNFFDTHDDAVSYEVAVHVEGLGRIENVLSVKSIQREHGMFMQLETKTETYYVNTKDIVSFTHL
jgi:hypothetical protein